MNAQVAVSAPLRASEEAVAQSRAIKKAWLEHIAHQPTTAAHHAVYALLRGKSLEKTFSPLKNPRKIAAQSGVVDGALQGAQAQARRLSIAAWLPFASLLEGVPTKFDRYERVAHPLLDRVEAQ